ncbi:hypothetical protein [Metabacillus sp. FJAT-53654]|uniref:Transposase n=1 Tax=Metabacillus rhizosphaerae TaxID=3117747 RepID=A0ABZ2MSJ8_9BACI
MSKVLMGVKHHLAFVTINREEQLNFFDYETLVELKNIVEGIKLRAYSYSKKN